MGAFIDNEVRGLSAVKRPYSHAAGYTACPRTEIVACSDFREEVMGRFGKVYGVPKARQYADFRQLIAKEKPDIVSVATQPEQRAEIVIHAARSGVRAIYAEKALAASLVEADAMVDAVEVADIAFNMGTNRRWDLGFDVMKDIVDSEKIGPLKSFIIYANGSLFNTSSHTFDLMLRMNNDQFPISVQASLQGTDAELFDGDKLKIDPQGEGIIYFPDGVTGYALNTPRNSEFEAICDRGNVTARNNGNDWELHERYPVDASGRRYELKQVPFPEFRTSSSTLALIEDLVHALDTDEPTRGGIQIARTNLELIFGFIESHRQGGARIGLPLKDRDLTLNRAFAPRQPRYEA